jgi:hypothetical protein
MLTDPRQTPKSGQTRPDEPIADETYPVFVREDADVPNLQGLFDAFTDQEKEPDVAPDRADEEAQRGHS